MRLERCNTLEQTDSCEAIMNKSETTVAPTAKSAYAVELQKVESAINTLSNRLEVALGDGTLSDKIHWSNVADLQRLSIVLERALDLDFPRIP